MSQDTSMSELNSGRLEYAPSIYSALEPSFRKNWSRPAVQAMHQESSHLASIVGRSSVTEDAKSDQPLASGLTWSYQQLHQGAVKLTAALRDAGIEEDSKVVTLLPNGADWCLIAFTCILGKMNLAGLDVGALQSARQTELENFLNQLEPAVIVVADAQGATSVGAAIRATGVDVPIKLTVHWDKDVAVPEGWSDLGQYGIDVDGKTETAILERARVDNHDRIAMTLFTSGTSLGRPKGCPRPVLSILHVLKGLQRPDASTTSIRLVDSANFRAICAHSCVVIWEEGDVMVISGPSPTPEGALIAMERYKISDIPLVPAMIRMIAAHPSYKPSRVKSIRSVATAGDVITRAVLDLIHATFPYAQGFNVHGMTEGANVFKWPFVNDKNIAYHGEILSFGGIRKGNHIKVVDEDGIVVPRGTPGELHINSFTTIRHYLDNVSAETFYAKDNHRWMKTGDIAIIDGNGYCFIVGRSKDIIKRAGLPITPGPLESCLSAYTGAEVVVVGIDHDILGAEPWAILMQLRDRTVADVKKQVVDEIGKDYALGGVVTLDVLGYTAWPLNATGKIRKVDLKAGLLKHLGR